MKLSVIIPIYNVADFLPRCINSVLLQTASDLEIILVDDCSTDDSRQICDDFATKYSNIKVIHREKNGGLSEARNTGIQSATGDYITFLDSDDFLDKETYKLNLKLLEENPTIQILEYPVWNSYNEKSEACFDPHLESYCIRTFDEWIADRGFDRSYAWNKIYKRQIWSDFSFPAGKYFEDLYTTPYIIASVGKIITSPLGKYYYFRQNMSSITNLLTKEKQSDLLEGNIKLFNFLKEEKGYTDEQLFKLYLGMVNIQILYKKLGGMVIVPKCRYTFKQVLTNQLPFMSIFKAILLKLTHQSFYKIYRI